MPRHARLKFRPGFRWLAATAVALTGAAALSLPAHAAISSSPRHVVAGMRPAWAAPSADQGAVAGGTPVNVRVYLAGQDPAGLADYARQVSDPASPGYQHYLTPAQFAQRFGPTGTQTQAVTGWLKRAGLTVTKVTDSYVAARGTAAGTPAAFGSQLHGYRTDQGTLRAPQAPVTVPASVAPAVLAITGLSTSAAKPHTDLAQPSPVNEGTCSRYWGQKTASSLPPAYGHTLRYGLCGYTPPQLRAAYGVGRSGLTGRGATIAIVDPGASPTIASDVRTYMSRHGGPPLRPGQLTQNLPSDINQSCGNPGTVPGAYGEESLDVEAAHTMAPGAHITYVGADCTDTATGLLDADARIVDGHLADIVSDSWHLGTEAQVTPDVVAAFQRVFEQGAAEGIGFYFSSGDSGDWSATTPGHQPAVQFPASDPWVTSVGGTALATSPHGRYEWETGWGTDTASLSADGTSWTGLPGKFEGGAGGGASSLFAQPSYQRGVVPASLSRPAGAASPVRVMPDIAADADPNTGMLVGLTTPLTMGGAQQYAELDSGGTSEATPLIAGIQADVQQARHGVPLGFANPALYARHGTWAYHDVTDHPFGSGTAIAVAEAQRDPVTGTITNIATTLARDSSLHATPGYDDVTGLGTPSSAYLFSYFGRGGKGLGR